MDDLLAPLVGVIDGDGWWGVLLFIPLLLAGHVSEGAVVYGLWRRSSDRTPTPRVWRVAVVSGAVAALFLVASMIWIGTYVAPRLVAELPTWP
jgi:hypothetical protein